MKANSTSLSFMMDGEPGTVGMPEFTDRDQEFKASLKYLVGQCLKNIR